MIRIRCKRIAPSIAQPEAYAARILLDGEVVGFGYGSDRERAVWRALEDFRQLREEERDAHPQCRRGWVDVY